MISFLLDQQKSLAKHSCYLLMWKSRGREEHWTQEWLISGTLEAGMPNINPIVRWEIIYTPLHIKLDFMKQVMKALNIDSECFQHSLCFTCLSFEVKAGVSVGPGIRAKVHDDVQCQRWKARRRWLIGQGAGANLGVYELSLWTILCWDFSVIAE